jgi:hypothetical protein
MVVEIVKGTWMMMVSYFAGRLGNDMWEERRPTWADLTSTPYIFSYSSFNQNPRDLGSNELENGCKRGCEKISDR